jgi:hypothetical protein
MQPSLIYSNGKLIAKAGGQVDKDNDGIASVKAEISIEINAMEAVNEIVKDGVPEWLSNLLQPKAEAPQA